MAFVAYMATGDAACLGAPPTLPATCYDGYFAE